MVSNSIIQGGFPSGTNILDVGPKFNDTLTGDLSLMMCSPAIDAGQNICLYNKVDLNGNTRLYNATGSGAATIDIGAYEFQMTNTGCCEDNLVLSGTITTGTYEAAISIQCDGVIGAGSDVMLSAPEINLTDLFEVEETGLLSTNSQGCSDNE